MPIHVDDIQVLAGAIGLLATQIATAVKTGSEARRLRDEVATVARATDRIHHEVTPNHGSSIKDTVDRSEAVSKEQMELLAEIRTTVHHIMRDQGGTKDDLRELRKSSFEEHQRMWESIGKRDKG